MNPSKLEKASKDPLRHADLFGDSGDGNIDDLFGKASITSNNPTNLFGEVDNDFLASQKPAGNKPEKKEEKAREKDEEIPRKNSETKTPIFGEPAEADSDLFGEVEDREKAAENLFDTVGELDETEKKVGLFDETAPETGLLAVLAASKEDRDLGGLFLPNEAVEQRADVEKHDSVDQDLLDIPGDESLDKFKEKISEPATATATTAEDADVDDLFSGNSGSADNVNFDDDLFSMAGAGAGGAGGDGVGDNFDFAAYISSNAGGSSSSSGGGTGNLFDD